MGNKLEEYLWVKLLGKIGISVFLKKILLIKQNLPVNQYFLLIVLKITKILLEKCWCFLQHYFSYVDRHIYQTLLHKSLQRQSVWLISTLITHMVLYDSVVDFPLEGKFYNLGKVVNPLNYLIFHFSTTALRTCADHLELFFYVKHNLFQTYADLFVRPHMMRACGRGCGRGYVSDRCTSVLYMQ